MNPSYEKSIKAMIREVERCAKIGIPYLVTHLGSHKGSGEENGIQRLTSALMKVAKATKDVTILLENTAGQTNSVGSDFTQLAKFSSAWNLQIDLEYVLTHVMHLLQDMI